MAYQFKVGDTGKTRGARPYRVLATDLKSSETIVAAITDPNGQEYAVTRFANGNALASGTLNGGDLMPPAPVVYINVYEREDGTRPTPNLAHKSRESANIEAYCAEIRDAVTRIGCIRVPLEALFDD